MTLEREISGEGSLDSKILVLTHMPTWSDRAATRPLSDSFGRLFFSQLAQAGVGRTRVRVESICERIPPGRMFYAMDAMERVAWQDDALRRIDQTSANVIVALGEEALQLLTDKRGIQKWHLSILEGYRGRKILPLLHPEYVNKVFKEIPFLTYGAQRAVEESSSPKVSRVERNLRIKPSLNEALLWLRESESAEWLSFDIETGQGQITCIGFSTNPREAFCIPTLPRDYGPEDFYALWSAIARTLGSNAKKVAQNGIYDQTYLSKYGIRVRNFAHDTMLAQKFLHPELPMGLDTVARLYTKEPYWKDEGKDWGLRQDISQLYYYNCKDAACTLEAAFAQRVDLRKRNLDGLFYGRRTEGTQIDFGIMRFPTPASQMCWTGLPVDSSERDRLKTETEARISEIETMLNAASFEVLQKPINPRSPLQIKALLRACGYKLPIKEGKESSNRESLMRLRLKHPESKILTPLIQISSKQKELSSYLNYVMDPDSRLRFTLYVHGTETGRWSSSNDPWGRGLNAQTIPLKLKSQFRAPAGKLLVEIDLRQAESRFVAYDGPVPKLIEMYRDGIDIHRFVASHPLLFNKPMSEITKAERQLGKKTGHAANYGMEEHTLSDSCLKEMDLVLPVAKARDMLAGYHAALDQGVRTWQRKIEAEVTRAKRLTTPLGRERYFYDRVGPDLFKEAYAYRPQSTVSDVINHLMLWCFNQPGVLLLDQIHDALLLEIDENSRHDVLERICDQDAWNPKLRLAGGELRIPIEVKIGKVWSDLEVVFEG